MEIEIVFHRGLICLSGIVLFSTLFLVLDGAFSHLFILHYLAADLLAFLLLALFLTPLREKIEATVGHWLPRGQRNPQPLADAALHNRLFSDLTERKRLEKEVRRAQRLASVGSMAAQLAHEIRNPLVALKTFCQLLPERRGDAEFVESFSSLVGKEVSRINALVEQLLDLSRLSPLSLRSIDLHRVLEETLALLQSEFLERGVEVVRRLHEGEVSILGDEEKLEQVFLNLLLNGLQAIEGTGSITISTQVRGQPGGAHWGRGPLERSAASGPQPEENGKGPPSEVWIQVADTGRGIPPEHLPHLFDPFFTTREKGAGLGLSICQGIVKEFQGEIDIESEVGKGTLVTLRLPLTLSGAEERK